MFKRFGNTGFGDKRALQWYVNDASVSGANAGTWTCTPITAGAYYIYLKVTDTNARANHNSQRCIDGTAIYLVLPVFSI